MSVNEYSKLISNSDSRDVDESTGEMSGAELPQRRYKRNLLTNAEKSFVFLEYQSLVDFVEADAEYVISAGRDHNIDVWDAIGGGHLRRFTGHSGPVTGLHLDNSSTDRIVLSASEDGDIRKWSISKGFMAKIPTHHVITCMGIINNVLAVTGNNKGYMEVRHLELGELYSSILAHEDPIEALAVEGNYACSAVFDCLSSVKVWEIQFEQTVCIYRIENPPDVEFRSVALWKTTVVLGATDATLRVIDFKNEEKRSIQLGRSDGSVQHVRIWNEWILSCCAYNENVVLDVHRIHNFEYFGTFNCNMKRVSATAATEWDNSFKIILGGSSLAILSFDFFLTQDVKSYMRSITSTNQHNFEQNKSKCHYTLKKNILDTEDLEEEESTDEEDDKAIKETSSYPKNILFPDFSPLTNIPRETMGLDIEVSTKICSRPEDRPEIDDKNDMINEILSVKPTLPDNYMEDIGSYVSEKAETENIFQTYAEPRVVARKLRQVDTEDPCEKKLGENDSIMLPEKMLVKNRCFQTIEDARRVFLKECTDNLNEEKFENLHVGDKCDISTDNKKEANAVEIKKEDNPHLLSGNINKTRNLESPDEKEDDKTEKTLEHSKKFCFRKNEKCKQDKKYMLEKNKRKKCCIM